MKDTRLLGSFWGVKEDGKLIAMAGERFKHPGYTEISGVCTHPDHLGRGLAHELCVMVAEQILARGETPYLHVFSTNVRAIKVYENLGFKTRRKVNASVLERALMCHDSRAGVMLLRGPFHPAGLCHEF